MLKQILILLLLIASVCSCGPRNPNISQQMLGEWFAQPATEKVTSIKFHTNKTFDIKFEDNNKIGGLWSTIDSAAAILNLQIQEYTALQGTWMVSIEDKRLSLISQNKNVKYDFLKK